MSEDQFPSLVKQVRESIKCANYRPWLIRQSLESPETLKLPAKELIALYDKWYDDPKWDNDDKDE